MKLAELFSDRESCFFCGQYPIEIKAGFELKHKSHCLNIKKYIFADCFERNVCQSLPNIWEQCHLVIVWEYKISFVSTSENGIQIPIHPTRRKNELIFAGILGFVCVSLSIDTLSTLKSLCKAVFTKKSITKTC